MLDRGFKGLDWDRQSAAARERTQHHGVGHRAALLGDRVHVEQQPRLRMLLDRTGEPGLIVATVAHRDLLVHHVEAAGRGRSSACGRGVTKPADTARPASRNSPRQHDVDVADAGRQRQDGFAAARVHLAGWGGSRCNRSCRQYAARRRGSTWSAPESFAPRPPAAIQPLSTPPPSPPSAEIRSVMGRPAIMPSLPSRGRRGSRSRAGAHRLLEAVPRIGIADHLGPVEGRAEHGRMRDPRRTARSRRRIRSRLADPGRCAADRDWVSRSATDSPRAGCRNGRRCRSRRPTPYFTRTTRLAACKLLRFFRTDPAPARARLAFAVGDDHLEAVLGAFSSPVSASSSWWRRCRCGRCASTSPRRSAACSRYPCRVRAQAGSPCWMAMYCWPVAEV